MNLKAEVSEVILEYLNENNIPGISFTIRSESKVVFDASLGFEDITRQEPLHNDARYLVYSVTKPLIALAALRLVEQRLLELDADVRTLLSLPFETAVSLRQLLNHAAGIPDYSQIFEEYMSSIRLQPKHPWTQAEFLEHTLPRGLDFLPGHGWAYSNVGYLLVRMLIEKITGQSLKDALEKFIFRPLELQKTFVAQLLQDAVCLTPAYSTLFSPTKELEDISMVYHPGWISHGVVISTASELAMIFEALFLGKLLKDESLEEMKQAIVVPGKHPRFGKTGYGLGLMIDLEPTFSPFVGHGGEGPGYSAAAFHFSDLASQRVTITALANREGHDVALDAVFEVAHLIGKRT